jgi:hypothetical protein
LGWTTGPLGEKPSICRAALELFELAAGGGGLGERRTLGTSTVGEAGEIAGEDDEKERAEEGVTERDSTEDGKKEGAAWEPEGEGTVRAPARWAAEPKGGVDVELRRILERRSCVSWKMKL